MKHVEACLSAWKDRESPPLCRFYETRATLFICGDEKDLTKQF